MLIPSSRSKAVKLWANAAALIGFLLCLPLVFGFDRTKDFQFVENAPWIPSIGRQLPFRHRRPRPAAGDAHHADRLPRHSLQLERHHDRLKEYYAFFLLLQTAMLGVFMSLDFLLFFVFWETVLVPMYFIIAIWGGPRRAYAAIKFMIYTLIGSVLMFLGILTLYFQHYTQFQTLQLRYRRPDAHRSFRRPCNGGSSGPSSWASR